MFGIWRGIYQSIDDVAAFRNSYQTLEKSISVLYCFFRADLLQLETKIGKTNTRSSFNELYARIAAHTFTNVILGT